VFTRAHRERFAQVVADDTARLGLGVVWTHAVEVGQQDLRDRIGQLARLAVVGEAKARATDLVMYRLDAGGSRMLYVQAFEREAALPAFLHARLPGGFRVPVTLRKKLVGVAWHAQDAPEIVEHLARAPALKDAAKALPWKKHSTVGHYDLEWVVQIRALGDGTSELVFQLGSTALDLFGTCLDRCLELREALRPAMLDADPPEPQQGLYWPAPYADLYWDIICDPD
jgi:hypothetical protein